jgi:hypothetical protein
MEMILRILIKNFIPMVLIQAQNFVETKGVGLARADAIIPPVEVPAII